MLTNAQVRTPQPKSCAYKLSDGQGLRLHVAPTGLKSWRARFRLAGREQLMTIGQFPDVDLSVAREAAAAASRARRDPREERAARAETDRTFEAVARAWHAHWRASWTEVHASDVITSLERDVFPAMGTIDVDDIGSADICNVLGAVEARGAIETSKRLRQRISKVFGFAIANEWAQYNPAASVKQALAATSIACEQLALVSIDDARELLAASAAVAAPAIVQLASRFLALTGVRLGALRGMQWDELHDIDWTGEVIGPPAPVWVVPAARMKLAKAKKADRQFDHVVPLSSQAVEVLRIVRALAIDPVLVFSRGDHAAPIAESAIGALYRKAGFAGRHVLHGWRAVFSPLLNERNPTDRVVIDRALGHAAKKGKDVEVNVKVEGAYNRSKQLGPRHRVMQIWADLLMPPVWPVRRRGGSIGTGLARPRRLAIGAAQAAPSGPPG